MRYLTKLTTVLEMTVATFIAAFIAQPIWGVETAQDPTAAPMPFRTVSHETHNAPSACPSTTSLYDIDLDGDVDDDDRLALKDALGTCEDDAGYLPAADYDNDGCITFRYDMTDWYRYRLVYFLCEGP